MHVCQETLVGAVCRFRRAFYTHKGRKHHHSSVFEPLPNGTVEFVAEAPKYQIFCYLAISETIHVTDCELALFKQLSKLWGFATSKTTPYHPQSNVVVGKGGWDLGDALRLMLFREDAECDLKLTHIMRSIQAMPHNSKEET